MKNELLFWGWIQWLWLWGATTTDYKHHFVYETADVRATRVKKPWDGCL